MACLIVRGAKILPSISTSSRWISHLEAKSKIFTNPTLVIASHQQPHRQSSFKSSPLVRDLQEYPEVEIVRNPPEWKYVERLLPPETVPAPPKEGDNFPSGWKPPRQYDPKKDTFFVRRNKNHMIPVYLMRSYRGVRQITIVRNIVGDIWALEKMLRKVIEASKNGKLCASRVNEMTGQLAFHGNHVDLLLNYLQEKGF